MFRRDFTARTKVEQDAKIVLSVTSSTLLHLAAHALFAICAASPIDGFRVSTIVSCIRKNDQSCSADLKSEDKPETRGDAAEEDCREGGNMAAESQTLEYEQVLS